MAKTKDRYVRVKSKNKAGYTVTKWKDTKTGKIVDTIPLGANVKPTGGELGVSTLSDDVKESTAQRQKDFIRSHEDRHTLIPDQNLISQAIGREKEYKASQIADSFAPFRTEMDSMFKRLIENPDFTDQQKFPSLKAMYSLQNSWFNEEYQEPTYSHAIAFGQEIEDKKNAEFIDAGKADNNDDKSDNSGLDDAEENTEFKSPSVGTDFQGTARETDEDTGEVLKTKAELDRERNMTIGSEPWARGNPSGTTYHEANDATEALMKQEGWDLRGLGIAQKQDLFSDYRTDRLPKTDTSIFFNNQRIKKR